MSRPTNTMAMLSPIKLQTDEVDDEHQSEAVSFLLRIIPTDDDSATYKKWVKSFENGNLEDFLILHTGIRDVIRGLNLTTGPGQFSLIVPLLQGDAKARWDRLAANVAPTVANFTIVLNNLLQEKIPTDGVVGLQEYLRTTRKPRTMDFVDFTSRERKLNSYLAIMAPGQEFDENGLARLIFQNTPRGWRELAENQNQRSQTLTIGIEPSQSQETGSFPYP